MSRSLGILLALFDRRQRWKLAGILAMNVVLALLEVAGIASIMPFISVLADPNAVAESRWLTLAYQGLGFETVRSFHLFLGVSVLALVFSSIAFSALAIWVMVRFAASMSYRFSVQLLRWYVHAP